MKTDSCLNDYWISPIEQLPAPTMPQQMSNSTLPHATSNAMQIVYGNSTLNNDKATATTVNQTPSLPINFSSPEGSGARESSNSSRTIKCLFYDIGHTCPICKEPKPIKRCSDFERHIDEHYTVHHCADCNKHYSRKGTLDQHRKNHHPGSDGSSVRDDLSPKPQKRNFACGYCCSKYHSAMEFAKHIHDYFELDEQLPPWYSDNVIRGLLSSIDPHWSGPNPQSLYSWNSTLKKVQELQEDLEYGLKQPEVLVGDAIALSNHGASQPIQTFNTSSLLSPGLGLAPTPFALQTSYPSTGALNNHAFHPPQPYTQAESGQGLGNQYRGNAFRMQPASSFSQQSEGQGGASYPPSYSGYPQSALPYATNNLQASQMAWGLNAPTKSFTKYYQPLQASTLASPLSFAPHPDAYNTPELHGVYMNDDFDNRLDNVLDGQESI